MTSEDTLICKCFYVAGGYHNKHKKLYENLGGRFSKHYNAWKFTRIKLGEVFGKDKIYLMCKLKKICNLV